MENTDDLTRLEQAVRDACGKEVGWAAGVVAGIYAGVDFAIAHPGVAESVRSDLEDEAGNAARREALVDRFTAVLQHRAPVADRAAGSTDAASLGGVIGLVGDYLRLGRAEHLAELRSELVLMVLLPYLGFEEVGELVRAPCLTFWRASVLIHGDVVDSLTMSPPVPSSRAWAAIPGRSPDAEGGSGGFPARPGHRRLSRSTQERPRRRENEARIRVERFAGPSRRSRACRDRADPAAGSPR